MAANLSWGALGKATDLRSRIFFTLGLLMVYRLGTYIPVPGIDGQALRDWLDAGHALGNHTHGHLDVHAVGLPAFQQFKPGRIDHHNVQIAIAVLAGILALALRFLLRLLRRRRRHAAAGGDAHACSSLDSTSDMRVLLGGSSDKTVGVSAPLDAVQQRIQRELQKQFDPQGVFATGRLGI